MARPAPAQSGLTLMELLIALAIATLLVAPLAAAVMNALKAHSVASDAIDVAQQAQFAMQRMEAAVRCTHASHPLAAKAAGTSSADWLAPVTDCLRASKVWIDTTPLDIAYCLRADNVLIETTSADTPCSGTRIIVDKVSAFGVQSFSAGALAGPVIEIQLSATGATGQSISLTSHTRLGGGTL